MSAQRSETGLSRRQVLAAAGLGLAIISPPSALLIASPAQASDIYDDLRERYRRSLVGPRELDPTDPDIAQRITVIDAAARTLLPLVDNRANRSGVFTDLVLVGATDSAIVTTSLTRLQSIAVAFAIPGSTFYSDPAVADIIVQGMLTVNELAYNTGQAEYDNWWDWEIGSAGRIGRVCTLLYEQIPALLREALLSAIDHFVPDPGFVYPVSDPRHKPSTGANRVDLCQIIAVRGILGKNSARITTARNTVPGAFAYVTTGDGLYADGSFIQHNIVAYTGSYGAVQLSGTSEMLALLAGSPWEVADPAVSNMISSVDRTFAPWIFDGAMMSSVRGRAVARSAASDHSIGQSTMLAMLRFAEAADPITAADWRRRVQGWIDRDHYSNILDSAGIPGIILAKDLLADASIQPTDEPSEHNLFPKMDRAVHRRRGWAAAFSLSSNRIARFEVMSVENKRPWHQGSGAVYLHLENDGDGHYSDAFWPTVDPYRLPGTTVDSQRLADVRGGAVTSFLGYGKLTGGTVVGGQYDGNYYDGGRYAALVHHEGGYKSTMRARMSWFGLDHGIVCLGSGITAGSGSPIETIIENRRVRTNGAEGWWVNGTEIAGSSTPGWTGTLSGVRYLTLPGTAGYVFLDGPRTVKANRENRTGSWHDISDRESATPITRGYLTAWLDHGTAPDNATYAYLLAPLASVNESAVLAEDPGVEILSNTTVVQAISVPGIGYIGANFYGRATVSAGALAITVDRMCSVSTLISRDSNTCVAEIAVSDPTQLDDVLTINVTLPPGRAWTVQSTDDTTTPAMVGQTLSLRIDTSEHDGRSHRVIMRA